MTWTLEASNTTLTDGTEQVLATLTGNKSYVFEIDRAAMQLADQIRIRVYLKTLVGGTEHVTREINSANAQGEPIMQIEPRASDISYKVTLQRMAGTDRSYPWKVLSL